MRPVMARLARWDRDTAGRVDRYVAISHYVAGRIGRYYNREATVVYPPVDTDFFQPDAVDPERFALVVSALVPYKRIDLAIDACRLARVPLKIVGDGPERARARTARRRFGAVPRPALRRGHPRASIGAPPSCCCPAKRTSASCRSKRRRADGRSSRSARGGALETVVHGETGLLVDEPTAEAFADAIAHASIDRRFDPAAIRRHAERFGRARFGDEMAALDGGAGPHGEPAQPAARRVPRPVRRAPRRVGVHPRLRAAVPHGARHPDPDHQGRAAAAAVHQRAAVHRGARAARLPAAGAVSPAPRAVARRRFLRRLRRQHPRRRLRHRRHAVRADLLRDRPPTRSRGAFEVSQAVVGASSSCSTSR